MFHLYYPDCGHSELDTSADSYSLSHSSAYAVAFAGLAVSLGIDPRIVTFSVVAMSSCVLLIPFDPVVIVAYTTRYFKIKDLFTAGVIVSTIWTLLLGVWLPIVFSII